MKGSKFSSPIIYSRIHSSEKEAVQCIVSAFVTETSKFDAIGTYYFTDKRQINSTYIEFASKLEATLYLEFLTAPKFGGAGNIEIGDTLGTFKYNGRVVNFAYNGNGDKYSETLCLHIRDEQDTETTTMIYLANEGERVIGEDAKNFMQGASWILLGTNDADITALFENDENCTEFDKVVQPYIDAAFEQLLMK